MAGGSFFLLLDDIASVLDDVATMSKVAAKKTAGVLGDDLALNAEQVTGVDATRELPVVWAVAKGSAVNKVILVPSALGISLLAPWAIQPLLMIGGLFLCWEGAEKILHKLLHTKEDDAKHLENHRRALQASEPQNIIQAEKDKIKGAVRTDFILSAEIIVISLGTVSAEPLLKQALVLITISVLMTIGVYGLVAGIVKLDDFGLWLKRSRGALAGMRRALGASILAAAPWLMRFLSIAGTAAMFLVGGGIVAHSVTALHHGTEAVAAQAVQMIGSWAGAITSFVATGLVGLVCGAGVLVITETVKRIRRRSPSA